MSTHDTPLFNSVSDSKIVLPWTHSQSSQPQNRQESLVCICNPSTMSTSWWQTSDSNSWEWRSGDWKTQSWKQSPWDNQSSSNHPTTQCPTPTFPASFVSDTNHYDGISIDEAAQACHTAAVPDKHKEAMRFMEPLAQELLKCLEATAPAKNHDVADELAKAKAKWLSMALPCLL